MFFINRAYCNCLVSLIERSKNIQLAEQLFQNTIFVCSIQFLQFMQQRENENVYFIFFHTLNVNEYFLRNPREALLHEYSKTCFTNKVFVKISLIFHLNFVWFWKYDSAIIKIWDTLIIKKIKNCLTFSFDNVEKID